MHYYPILFTKQVPWYKRLWYRRELRDINALINTITDETEACYQIILRIIDLESRLNLPGKYCFDTVSIMSLCKSLKDEINLYHRFLTMIPKRKAGAFPRNKEDVDALFNYINAPKFFIPSSGMSTLIQRKAWFLEDLNRDQRFECYDIYYKLNLKDVEYKVQQVHSEKLKYLHDDNERENYIRNENYSKFIGEVEFSDLETVHAVYHPYFGSNKRANHTTQPFKMFTAMSEKRVAWRIVKQQTQDAGFGFPFVRRWIERVKNWFSPTNHPTIKKAEQLAEIREDKHQYILIDEERTAVIKTLKDAKNVNYSVHTQHRVNKLSQAILGHGSDCIDKYAHLDVESLSIMSKHEFSNGVIRWHDFLEENKLLSASNLQYYTVLRGLVENQYNLESILKTYDGCFNDLEGQGKLDNFVKNIPIFYIFESNDSTLYKKTNLIEDLHKTLKKDPDLRLEILRAIFRKTHAEVLKTILTNTNHPQHDAIWTILKSYYDINTHGGIDFANSFNQFLSFMLQLLESGFSDFGVKGISDSCSSVYALFHIIQTCPDDAKIKAIMNKKFAAMKASAQLIAVGNSLGKYYYNLRQPKYYKDGINEIQYLFLNVVSINDVTVDLIQSAYYLRHFCSVSVRSEAVNQKYDVSELMDCLMKIPNEYLVQINRAILRILEETPEHLLENEHVHVKRLFADHIRHISNNPGNQQIHQDFLYLLGQVHIQNGLNRNGRANNTQRRPVDVHNRDFTPVRNKAYIAMKEKTQPRATPFIRADMSSCIKAYQAFIKDTLNNMIKTLISEKNPILVNKYFEHVYVRKFVIAEAQNSAEFKTWFISALDRQVEQKGKDSSLSVWYSNATSPISDWKESINKAVRDSQEPSVSPEKYFPNDVPEIYQALSWSELFTLADGVELCASEKLDSATTAIPNNSFLKSETSFDRQSAENILYLVWSYLMGKSTSAEVEALKLKVIISLGEIRAAYYHNSYDGNASISCPKGALERLLDTIAAEDPTFKAVIPPKAQGSPQAVSGVEASFDSATISNYAMRSARDKATAYLLSENCDVNELSACYDAATKTWSISPSVWLKIKSEVKAGIMAECGTPVSTAVSDMIEAQMALFIAADDPLYVYVEFSAEQASKLSARLTQLSGCSPKATVLYAWTAFSGEAPPDEVEFTQPLVKPDAARHDL